MTTATRHDSLAGQFRAGREELRDIGEELADIAEDVRGLARGEVELAKAEMAEQFSHALRMAMWGGIALLGVFITLFFAGMTIMFALGTAMPLWAAALVTTALLATIVGAFALLAKKELKSFSVVPRRTMHSVREDIKWAKAQLKSNTTTSGAATP